jgi:hypothetical protein
VLTAANAPEHVGIYANQSRTNPGEFTVDLVNYHHDLAADHLTPVTRTDFTLTLQVPHLKSGHSLVLESIRYDETAPGNTLWRPLDIAHATVSEGTLTLRIPPFTYYQILRLRTSGQ